MRATYPCTLVGLTFLVAPNCGARQAVSKSGAMIILTLSIHPTAECMNDANPAF